MSYQIECEFSTPVNLGNDAKPDYEYSIMNCSASSNPQQWELIENASTGASFFLTKTITYGDILVITFLMLFLIFGILKFLTDFLIPKIFNWKRR